MWNRKLWGVAYVPQKTPHNSDESMLIGQLWDDTIRQQKSPKGLATSPLLFTNRRAARDWCVQANATSFLNGKFRPVRVVHTVRRIAK